MANPGRFENAIARTLSGKSINAGQTCIAPDYVLVHESIQEELIAEIKMRSKDTDNLVELYHYKLVVKEIGGLINIPQDAQGLIKAVQGNIPWEELLYKKLGWSKK